METKICRNCKKEKPVKEFKPVTALKDRVSKRTGEIRLRSYCDECDRVMTIERQKKSYQKLKEKRLAYQRQYYKENHEIERTRKNKYKEENREYFREYSRNYYRQRIKGRQSLYG